MFHVRAHPFSTRPSRGSQSVSRPAAYAYRETYGVTTKDGAPTCTTAEISVVGLDAAVDDVDVGVGASGAVVFVHVFRGRRAMDDGSL